MGDGRCDCWMVRCEHAEATHDALESQLAEAERTIGQLRHRIGEIEDERGATIAELRAEIERIRGNWAHVAVDYGDDPETPEFDPKVVIRKLRTERDEAKRVAVWVWESAQPVVASGVNAIVEVPGVELYGWESAEEVYAALRRAMGESE